MAFSDYSTDPNANTSIAGINIAENCPAANVNNALRQLAADGKALANTVAALGSYMPLSGGAFTGEITRQGRGAYLHNNDSAATSGRVHRLAEGTALPSGSEGDMVIFYS